MYLLLRGRQVERIYMMNDFGRDVLAGYCSIHYTRTIAEDNNFILGVAYPLDQHSFRVEQDQGPEEITVGV